MFTAPVLSLNKRAAHVQSGRQFLERLSDWLGLFGVRCAVSLIASGEARTASALSSALIERSGLRELRLLLASRFAARANVLKARSALLTVEAVLGIVGSHELLDRQRHRGAPA